MSNACCNIYKPKTDQWNRLLAQFHLSTAARRKYSYSLQRNPKPFWTVVLRTDAAGGQQVRHLSQRPDRRSIHRNGRIAGRHSHQISGPTQVRRTSMQDQPHQTSSCQQQRLGGDLLGCISMLPYLILLLLIRSPNGGTTLILTRRARKKDKSYKFSQ